jgi:CGNR zinc finger
MITISRLTEWTSLFGPCEPSGPPATPLDLVSGGDVGRVRRCTNPDCNILFLDTSRPGKRRWCSMATCGNQAKKANQRARHAEAGSCPPPRVIDAPGYLC